MQCGPETRDPRPKRHRRDNTNPENTKCVLISRTLRMAYLEQDLDSVPVDSRHTLRQRRRVDLAAPPRSPSSHTPLASTNIETTVLHPRHPPAVRHAPSTHARTRRPTLQPPRPGSRFHPARNNNPLHSGPQTAALRPISSRTTPAEPHARPPPTAEHRPPTAVLHPSSIHTAPRGPWVAF